jgi:hypothetical protein
MDPDTPFDVLSDPEAVSRIVCHALGSVPATPYTQASLQAALSTLPPALFDDLSLVYSPVEALPTAEGVCTFHYPYGGVLAYPVWGFLPVFHGDRGDVYFFESVLAEPYMLMAEGDYLEVPMTIAASQPGE